MGDTNDRELMNHPSEAELWKYLDDSLGEQEIQQVETHLESCEACRSTLKSIVESSIAFHSTEFQWSGRKNDAPSWLGDSQDFQAGFIDRTLGTRRRFIILDELDRGGMGIVYRGFDRELKREVAIKVLQEEKAHSADRFYREAQVLGQIQHPGIVPVYATGYLEDRRMFIAMKLVSGKTLARLVHESGRGSNLPEMLGLFGQICETLAYAHSQNIVHRDLKPGNVMVGEFGEVQVMDWGLAKRLSNEIAEDEQDVEVSRMEDSSTPNEAADPASEQNASPLATHPGDVMGTPAYMPPEQAQGLRVDRRTDVFALGGILFHILTGKAPFEAQTKSMSLAKSKSHDPTRLIEQLEQNNVDPDLVGIVASCLAARVEDRPTDAAEVNEKFKTYLASREQKFEEARLASARAAERLIEQQKRSRQLAWFSMGIIATLLTAVVAGYMYFSEKNRRESEQAKIELEQLQRVSSAENQIRVSLASAKRLQERARKIDTDAGAEDWQAAVYEVRQAESLADEPISEQLAAEVADVSAEIESESGQFFRRKTREDEELACRDAVREICYQSLYPPSLRVALFERLTDQLEEAYGKLGVKPHDMSEEAVSRLANSEYMPFLTHGLHIWRLEVNREKRRFGPRPDDETRRDWLSELIFKADEDPFRTKVRNVFRDRSTRAEKLSRFMQEEESTGSLASVLLCTPCVEYLEKDDEKVDYLLRAQRAFPEEFQIKWKLTAVNGPDTDEKLERGLRNTLACYALQPENPAVLMNLGATYISQGNYDLGIETLKKVIEVAPNFIDARCNMAIAYQENGQLETALQACEEILALSRDHYWTTRWRGFVYEEMERPEEAMEDYHKALELNPDDIEIMHKLHELYRQRDELDQAAIHLLKAVEKQPKNAEYRYDLGDLYVAMEQWEKAEDAFTTVLESSPTNSNALTALANVHLRLDQPEQAESLLRDAIVNGVNDHSMQLTLAKSCLATSSDDPASPKRKEGIRILRKLNELVPEMEGPGEVLKRLEKDDS